MSTDQRDAISPVPTTHLTRRRSLGVLGLLGVAGLWRDGGVEAKKKKPKHQQKRKCFKVGYPFCVDGETILVDSCGRKKLLKRGLTPGRCPVTCVPQCADCTGGEDGCGGVCSCPEGQMCVDATCEVAP